MISLSATWNRIHHEASLIGPAFREGCSSLKEHKPLIAFLALATVFGTVANRGTPTEIIDTALTAAGWAMLPFGWGRAAIAQKDPSHDL
jgi:hypothetical protein